MEHVKISNPWADVLATWSARLDPESKRRYRVALDRLRDFVGAQNHQNALQHLLHAGPVLASRIIAEWAQSLTAEGLAPRTVAAYVRVPVHVFTVGQKVGAITWSPLLPKLSSEARHDRTGPSRADLERLVAHLVAANDPRAVRDLAAVRLMACAGLRRGEVAGLTRADVRFGPSPRVRVTRKGKSEPEWLSITERTADTLRDWIELRGGANDTPLFPSGDVLRTMLRNRSRDAGIFTPVRPHGLRHRGATEAAQVGLAALLAFGGWASMRSAMHYLDDQEQQRSVAMARADL